jgi:hypothetical protein
VLRVSEEGSGSARFRAAYHGTHANSYDNDAGGGSPGEELRIALARTRVLIRVRSR